MTHQKAVSGEKKIKVSYLSADYALSEMKGLEDGEEREKKPSQFSQTS